LPPCSSRVDRWLHQRPTAFLLPQPSLRRFKLR
jgi:hypothetical protein